MSDNNLSTQTSGTTIEIGHVNQYKEALTGDLVPRNTSGAPEDEAGSFGTDIYRWLKAVISTMFTNKLSIGAEGTEANNPYFDQTTSSLNYRVVTAKNHNFYIGGVLTKQINPASHDFYVSGVLKGQVTTNGVEGSYLRALSVAEAAINTGAVTEAKIGTGAVTETKIGSLAVTSGKIGNSAVTNVKIADGVIAPIKMIARNVTTTPALNATDSDYYVRTYTDTARTSGATASYNGETVTITNSAACCAVVDFEVNSTSGTGTLQDIKIRTRSRDYALGTSATTASFVLSAGENLSIAPRYTISGAHTSFAVNLTFKVYILR